MKLKSLRVENYGKLAAKEYVFSDGANEIFGENGYGKTTLASFLKAMFYGLPPVRANAKEFNDRMRYYPFSGGKFGGSLEMEFNGKNYRIERFFDKKSPINDQLKVFENNLLLDDFNGEPGFFFFGLDADSYVRTTFIDSTVDEICSTGTINGLLGEYLAKTDGSTFDDAIDKLTAAAKKYKQQRGSNDKISITKAKISDLNFAVENLEKVYSGLDEKYARLSKLEAREKQAKEVLKAAAERKVRFEKRKTYDSLVSDADKLSKKLDSLVVSYGNSTPSPDDVERAENLLNEIEKLSVLQSETKLSDEKNRRLQAYRRTFENGIPSADALKTASEKIDEIARLQAENDAKASGADDVSSFPKAFSEASTPERIERLERDFRALDKSPISTEKPQKTGKARLAAACSVSIVGIVATAISLALSLSPVAVFVGAALFVCGAAASAVCLLKDNKTTKLNREPDEKLKKESEERENLSNEIDELLSSFGYVSDDKREGYYNLKSDYSLYLATRARNEKAKREERENQNKIDDAKDRVINFFNKFGIDSSDLGEGLYLLKRSVEDYLSLREERRSQTERAEAITQRAEEKKEEARLLLSRFNLSLDGDAKSRLKSIETDLFEIERLKKDLATANQKALRYKEENGVDDKERLPSPEETDLEEEYRALQRSIVALKQSISADENDCESLYEKKSRLETEENNLKAYREKLKNIESAKKFLTQANDFLQEKYVAPIKDKFVKFAAPIEKALGEKVRMDKDFQISFEREGEIRHNKHLSAGQRMILSLCFRFSLIENAFPCDKPFVVMDDPFVSLDKEHIERAAAFLQEISQETQIIYLYCHESRKLN